MRILLINYEYPPLGGGAANATANIARALAACGHTVFVMTSRWNDLPHEQVLAEHTVIRIPAHRTAVDRSNPLEMLSFMVSACFQVLKLRNRLAVDCTIAFFSIPSGPAAWVLKAATGAPYIVSLRGGDVPGVKVEGVQKYHILMKPVIQLLWNRAAHVVANSQSLADLAAQSSRGKPILVIPNGVDMSFFTPGVNRQRGRWMFAGRITAQKGLDHLIEAVSRLDPDERRSLRISVVGDGPYLPTCIQLAGRFGVSDQFEFEGWKRREQMLDYYQSSEGFVFPTLFEGMPNVLLEAMACGLPIISTRAPGVEGLVQENGWLVTPTNVDELSDRLRYALRHPDELRDMGESSRRIAESFSWGSVAQHYAELMR